MRLMETGPITYLRYNILLPSNLAIIAESILGPYCCQWRRWRPRRAPNRWNYTIQRQRGSGREWGAVPCRAVQGNRRATLLSDWHVSSPCSSPWAIIGIFDCSGRQVKRVSVGRIAMQWTVARMYTTQQRSTFSRRADIIRQIIKSMTIDWVLLHHGSMMGQRIRPDLSPI